MELKEYLYVDSDLPQGWKPYYIYLMIVMGKEVGKLVLRYGTNEERYYDGHIGYTVEPDYRGHNYAYQATQAVLPIAKKLGFEELIITCSPDNIASKKTILKLPVTYLETRKIPRRLRKFFEPEETIKEIYLLKIGEN